MRKFYFFLIAALLMPVMTFALENKAVYVSSNRAGYKVMNTVEIPYRIIDAAAATKPGMTPSYSVAFWVNPGTSVWSSIMANSEGSAIGTIFSCGQMNMSSDWTSLYSIGYTANGKVNLMGHNGAEANGFCPETTKAPLEKTLNMGEWNFIVITLDQHEKDADGKCGTARLYINGEIARDAELTSTMFATMGESASDPNNAEANNFTFNFLCDGAAAASLDEVSFYNRALTAEEVAEIQQSAYTSSALCALYEFNEENGTTGHFTNVAPGGADIDALFIKRTYAQYWADPYNLCYPSAVTTQAASLVEGRTIEVKDVTIEIPETEGGSITMTPEDGDAITTGTHTLQTQSIYTVEATPADGYNLIGVYTKLNGNVEVEMPNGGKYVIVGDASVYGKYSNDFAAVTINVGEGADFAVDYKGQAIESFTALMVGETYNMTVTMTDETRKLTGVYAGDDEIEAVNGVYSFVAQKGLVITIETVAKPVFNITIEDSGIENNYVQALKGEDVVTTALEGDEITFQAVTDDAHVCLSFTVNGEKLSGSTYTVMEDITVSGEFVVSAAVCEPEYIGKYGTQTRNTGRYISALTVSSGENSVSLTPGGNVAGREIYVNNLDKILEIEPGEDIKFVATGSGEWMHTTILIDFNEDGFNEYNTNSGDSAVDAEEQAKRAADPDYFWYESGNCKIAGTRVLTNIPMNLREGVLYRVRYLVDWNGYACHIGQAGNDNGEYWTDFFIKFVVKKHDDARTVSVAPNSETLGSAAILFPVTEESSVTTDAVKVIVNAELATEEDGTAKDADAVFVSWTNADKTVLSTDKRFTYTDAAAAALTANFGYTVNFSCNEGGSVAVLYNGSAIGSGAGVPVGEKVSVQAMPESGFEVSSITINGEAATGNDIEVTVDGTVTIVVEFAKASYKYTATVTGAGSVAACYEVGEGAEGEAVATDPIAIGSELELESELYIFFNPNDGESLQAATVTSGENTYVFGESTEYEDCGLEDGNYYLYVLVEGSVNVEATFSGEASIDGIAADGNEAVEFFNLQGVRVNSKNLVPGVYVRRQGSKAEKVYVTK